MHRPVAGLLAGRAFHYGVEAPGRSGAFALVFEHRGRIRHLYIGEGPSIRSTIADALSEHPPLRRLTQGFYRTPAARRASGRRAATAFQRPGGGALPECPPGSAVAIVRQRLPTPHEGHRRARANGRLPPVHRPVLPPRIFVPAPGVDWRAHVRWRLQRELSYGIRTDTFQPDHGARRVCVSAFRRRRRRRFLETRNPVQRRPVG